MLLYVYTVGFHFVVPRFVEPNGVQKPEPVFKKIVNFFVSFFQKNCFFFNTNCWVCYNYAFSFLTRGATIAHNSSGLERPRAHSKAICSIFICTNRIEPVFLAPFRLYCKLVRKPGQGCSSAPWAPCRMQPSYRSFTVHHGVWF